jgi:hypothetical protein
MSEKSRHKSVPTQEKRVAGIGMSERKLATYSRVAEMSPTCRRHFQPSVAAAVTRKESKKERGEMIPPYSADHRVDQKYWTVVLRPS